MATSRTWIKLHCDKWLTGTLREESPEVRGVFADILALAGSGYYGDTGEIKLPPDVGLTDGQIAAILNVSEDVWRRSKQRLMETERIEVSEKGVISVVNWRKYQSEYERQKPYRPDKAMTGEGKRKFRKTGTGAFADLLRKADGDTDRDEIERESYP